MRIAVLADIHGNLLALDNVLGRLEAAPVDQIVCLGDVASDGPQPAGVVDRLRGLGCPVVRGNMDDWVLDPGPPEGSGQDLHLLGEIQHWGASRLSRADRDYLRTFSETVSVRLAEDARLLCVHGSPRSNTDNILPTTPEDELDRQMAGLTPPTILASGHTHAAMVRRHREMILMNPGSVGSPSVRTPGGRRPCWAEYAVITWDHGAASIDLRREPVDFDQFARTARDSGMPHADWWVGGW